MGEHEILLVDDNPQILRVFAEVLEYNGYQVTKESSGEAAVERLSGKDFDVVITDLNMYQTDGIAVLRKAKEQNTETVVILFTGDDQVTSLTDALSFGFDDYLTKPCRLNELVRRVAYYLETLDHKRGTCDGEELGRRDHPRYPVNKAVFYYCKEKRMSALALDLGQGGMKIKTTYRIPGDECMNFRLVLRDDYIWLKGRRVYSKLVFDHQVFSGIQFSEVSGEDYYLLGNYLATLEKWPKRRAMISAGEVTDAESDTRRRVPERSSKRTLSSPRF